MEEIVRQICEQARLVGACDKFTGRENLGELIALFTSPQGLEFCIRNNFPNITTYRAFKRYEAQLQSYGIYIDAGAVTLRNPRMAVLIGRTSATVTFDTLERHEVVVLQGAKCVVGAWRWAVVRVHKDSGSEVIKSAYNNAIIL